MREPLSFEKLARRFGNFWALADASGEIPTGKITALTGENGSGKSTLLLILSGILKPHKGSMHPSWKNHAHLVAHHAMAYADLSLEANLRLAAILAKRKILEIPAALDYWQISALQKKTLRTLSRGQLQRFLLARATVVKSPVLLLDEPFTGLDSASEKRLADFMVSQANAGNAVLFSEHLHARAMELSHKTLHMDRGVLKQ